MKYKRRVVLPDRRREYNLTWEQEWWEIDDKERCRRCVTFYVSGEVRTYNLTCSTKGVVFEGEISKDKFEAVFHLYYKT